ncbi:hypothetical protein EYF80_021508 [Liparis tanakae]|uniref:Uncharacterized protein n=1 Tax=Liparis tanakae TaxID=230148 RepID=A0A4Z2HSR6_9TELE|nr:hypothetical protein EYF80_021508 [Liparis tanakae]
MDSTAATARRLAPEASTGRQFPLNEAITAWREQEKYCQSGRPDLIYSRSRLHIRHAEGIYGDVAQRIVKLGSGLNTTTGDGQPASDAKDSPSL